MRSSRLVGSPRFPITATFPGLGPLGFLPLPVKFRIHFGSPTHFEGAYDAEDAEIEPKVEIVKGEIARLVAEGLTNEALKLDVKNDHPKTAAR